MVSKAWLMVNLSSSDLINSSYSRPAHIHPSRQLPGQPLVVHALDLRSEQQPCEVSDKGCKLQAVFICTDLHE